MKALVVSLLLVVVGCHKPARKFGMSSIRNKIAAVIASGAVKIDANKAIAAANQAPPAPPPPRDTPRPAPQQRHEAPPPAQHAEPPPAMQVTRVDASRATVFVLRGQTHGGESFCEAHTTIEACNSACTTMLRANMMSKPAPSTPKGCACTEADRGC